MNMGRGVSDCSCATIRRSSPTPDGAPPAFSGLTRHADIGYLLKRLKEICLVIGKNSLVKQASLELAKIFHPVSCVVSSALVLFYTLGRPVAFTLAALATTALVWRLIRLVRLLLVQAARQVSVRQAAARQFLQFCQALRSLEIERIPAETAESLARRTCQQLMQKDNPDHQLCSIINDFVQEYSKVRFGHGTASYNLLTLGQAVRERLRRS